MPNYISQIDFGDDVVRDIKDSNEAKTRGVLGAKNLLNNTSKTNTANGITFTVNADKSVTMTASNVTAGTSFKVGDTFKLLTGKYILTGAYGGSEVTYKLLLSYGGMQYSETGNGLSFTVSSADTEYEVYARVPGEMVGQSISATVYPMIRLATDTDPTYQPYAKTNYQLTPTLKSTTLSAGSTSVTFTGLPTSGNHLIDFYTSTGINYKAIDTATAGQVTLTFDAQSNAVTVYCEIKEV